ncbi:flavin reductase family protein [Nocardia sp. NPDC057455]|uniref:flavin reductase family protein n=1 Tax=Nocardia sp. NPDC057455 TaxID=3346138 RepID=UPI00366B585C
MIDSAELCGLGVSTIGATVVTTGWPRPHGMTADAFTSVSLDPPLILVYVAHTARPHRAIHEAGAIAVSVLPAHQEPVARYFADSARPTAARNPTGSSGCPARTPRRRCRRTRPRA